MSLPIKVIDRLFSRLAVTYGSEWDRKLGTAPIADVKTCWCHELSGFNSEDGLKAIAWALENLPERCPNVIEFRVICRRSPSPELPRLEAPKADPVVVAAALEKQLEVRKAISMARTDGLDWARRIVSRVANGDTSLSRYARESAELALGKRARMSA